MFHRYKKLIVNTIGKEVEDGRKNTNSWTRVKEKFAKIFSKYSIKQIYLSEVKPGEKYEVDELVINDTNDYIRKWLDTNRPNKSGSIQQQFEDSNKISHELFSGKPIKDILELADNPTKIVFNEVNGKEISIYGGGIHRAINAGVPITYKESRFAQNQVIFSK